ncbi:MAG: phosphoribosylformylglycinamidine synthase I [Nitrososphaerales archaeon]
MLRERIRICIMRVGGSNRDADVASCLEDLGVNVEVLHLNDILRRRNLLTYNGLVFPGGFAYGDYVRAGAIWAKRILAFLKDDVRRFAEGRRPILGICNGFQVLVELGLLPGFEFLSEHPQSTLASNSSGRFECRWITLRKNPKSNCIFAKNVPGLVRFPVAHGEGRFIARNEILKQIEDSSQVVFQYATREGKPANGAYPDNPNGSMMDIAGVSDPSGTIFGLMPHPENAYRGYQLPDWTANRKPEDHGDGYALLKSMVDYIEQAF